MLYCHCPAGCIVHSDHTFSVTYISLTLTFRWPWQWPFE